MAAFFEVAIDPGKGGGFAWVNGNGVSAHKMPGDDAETLRLVREIIKSATLDGFAPDKVRASLELVGGYIKPDRLKMRDNGDGLPGEISIEGGQPGSAMFSFGENAGLVRGMFLALGAVVEMVPPKRWQQMTMLQKGKDTKEEWKRKLKRKAQLWFPNNKVTLNTADALCILAYRRPDLISRGMRAEEPKKSAGGAQASGTVSITKTPGEHQLEIPQGFRKVTGGTTRSGDMCWNKDAERWERVDSVNEYIEYYYCVIRPDQNQGGALYLGVMAGKPKVFRKTISGKTFIVRDPAGDDLDLPQLTP